LTAIYKLDYDFKFDLEAISKLNLNLRILLQVCVVGSESLLYFRSAKIERAIRNRFDVPDILAKAHISFNLQNVR
jgi:hypothetical protein